jgi:hypothetical protein
LRSAACACLALMGCGGCEPRGVHARVRAEGVHAHGEE